MKIWKKDYYEKLMGLKPEVKPMPQKSVSDLQLEIQALQKQIQELQAVCTHPHYNVAFWSSRPGHMQPAHVCVQCNAYIGEATKEEADALWKRFGYNCD
jgi:hypothetical protein